MLRPLSFGMVCAVFWLGALGVLPVPAEISVPPPLVDWQGWVLHGEEYRDCPFLASSNPNDRASFRCAWPGQLAIAVDGQGGSFSQSWQVFAEGWVPVPGSAENWPRDMRVDDQPGVIVMHEGRPSAWLAAGSHTISGRFAWASRPEALQVGSETGLINLTVDGLAVAQPARPGGMLWLGKRRASEQPQQTDVQVYRLVIDDVPVRLVTRIGLQVAGEGREEILGRVLPDGFTPLSLTSELPARLDADGRLRVQVRPGSWEITLAARGTNVAETLSRPPVQGNWPREEIWSFAGNDRLRVAVPEGVEGIDPVQSNVPAEWQGFPAFRMSPESILRIVERSRGLSNADENRLKLVRRLWLDFDHKGFTAVDQISGSMRSGWRLDMAAPYRLESARSGGEPLLVTDGAEPGTTGVELRDPRLDLATVARLDQGSGRMPATGWLTRFEQAGGRLHLPPGHRLLAVLGVDDAPGSWVERWGLWNLFGVLIVVVFTGWVAGRLAGAVALAGLLLMYPEDPWLIWLWGNLLVAMAVSRSAPEGRFRRFAGVYRSVSFVVLGAVMLPFLWTQVRYALYPQLEAGAGIPFESGDIVAGGQWANAPAPRAKMEPPQRTYMKAEMEEEMSSGEAENEGASLVESDGTLSLMSRKGYGRRYLGQNVQRYAPGTNLQAGPGIPDWRFQSYAFGWSGPVEPGQTLRFLFIGPFAMLLWRIAGVGLLALLFFRLLRQSFGWSWKQIGGRAMPKTVPAVFVLAVLLAPRAWASSTPNPALLDELKSRLTQPPECAPTCAEIVAAVVVVNEDRLEVTLRAGALANLAVAVPSANDRWQIEQVTVDGRASLTVRREGDGSLWVPVRPGIHSIHLAGRLALAESVQLVFPQAPRNVSVTSRGWDVSGVNEGRLLSGSIELVRRRAAADSEDLLDASAEFPAFVRVERDFNLDLDWSMTTTVERLAPVHAAITVEVPLVSGESVLTEGIEVSGDRTALVGLAPGQAGTSWRSVLPRSETLELSVPQGTGRTEVWNFVINPQWNVTFEGLPAVLPEDLAADIWTFQYYPRPGETLKLRITRPKPAEGRTLAIDSVRQSVSIGKRSSTTSLEFRYRSTQGGRHAIELPEDARVTAVAVDGSPLQLRPEKNELSIALLPGGHTVNVQWTLPAGPAFRTRPAAVDLRSPASNVSTTVALPDSRWILAAFGKGVGPAVLYWGEFVVFLVTAWLLGRSAFSPIRGREWLLLGLGLSTLSWAVFVAMAAWFFTMRWRERWDGGTNPGNFNGVQIMLGLLTLGAIGCLVFSGVRYGLLAAPDMGICGPGSAGHTLTWFVDQTVSALPQPAIVSVPIWIYKALMFAWALWIALALARWLRWARHAWTTGGLWRSAKHADTTHK